MSERKQASVPGGEIEAGRGDSEAGSAMVMAIFVLVMLTGMGGALLFLSRNEVQMSQAALGSTEAFYIAEAGVEDARRTLFAANGGDDFNEELDASAGANDTVDFDPTKIAPTFYGMGVATGLNGKVMATGFGGFGDDQPLKAPTSFAGGMYTAFLTNDPGELAGANPLLDTDDRVMITGIGVGGDRSMEVVQAIIEPEQPLPPLPPAAIYLAGESPEFTSGTSNTTLYSGNDCGSSGATTYAPIVGTSGDAAETIVESGWYKGEKGKDGKFENGPDFEVSTITNPEETIANLNDTSEPALGGAPNGLDPQWMNCQQMIDLVESFRPIASFFCETRTGNKDCPLPAGTQVTDILFIDGNTNVGSDAKGTLVVTGNVTIHGGTNFEGIILAIGEGVLSRTGGGNGVVSGAVVVADVAGPDETYGTKDDCTGSSDGFGSSHYDVSGGGNGNIEYCTAHITAANPVTTYRVVEFLQR